MEKFSTHSRKVWLINFKKWLNILQREIVIISSPQYGERLNRPISYISKYYRTETFIFKLNMKTLIMCEKELIYTIENLTDPEMFKIQSFEIFNFYQNKTE